ncbi:PQQ-binding-like beta-propeller repeat protein [bacterium]|nr:PQQ-binding-like beta-propeller repeat protein [bacterium]
MKSRIYTAGVLIAIVTSLFCQQTGRQKGSTNWPSFRGPNASGIADGYATPVQWNLPEGENIRWKTEIPGLAHSSPVIWGDRLYITTAVSSNANQEMKVGLYGDIAPVEDESVHAFRVYCLNRNSGKIIWERTAHEGVPKVKRHPKSTHANSTPATDGEHVVAFFGSEGLYCYDREGTLLWKKDFGVLDAAFFIVPSAQWGFGSSPVIYNNSVIVQCDVMEGSFLGAFDLESGDEIWRVSRDDVPTWGTPTVYSGNGSAQVIVNGWRHAGGYDAATGEEIWRLSGGGDIPVPTPVVAGGLIFLNSAHGMMSPIYAIRPDARGDISLGEKDTANAAIVWSIRRGGAYMQTPLIYNGYLYNLRGNGYLSCFEANTGRPVYQEKVGDRSSFSASGVAADGKLYFPGEQGDIFVVKEGPDFELLANNPMGDICMATPAISEGVLYFRTQHYVAAVGK